MAKEKEQKKKIIVDEDWKQEALKEKEVLAAQEEAEKKEKQQEERRHGPLPEGNLAALIGGLLVLGLVIWIIASGSKSKAPKIDIGPLFGGK